MTKTEWTKLRYFREDEPWGEPSRMNYGLLRDLDKARRMVGRPFYVTYGTQGNHAPGSQHYKGLAVDFVVSPVGFNTLDAVLLMLRLKFDGIGVYVGAKYAGIKDPIAFHVEHKPGRVHRGMWLGYKAEGESQYKYTGLTYANLKKFSLIA